MGYRESSGSVVRWTRCGSRRSFTGSEKSEFGAAILLTLVWGIFSCSGFAHAVGVACRDADEAFMLTGLV
jgi:hypothetical protein